MRIGLVNRFYPPDPAPTGVEAQRLARALAAALPEAAITVYATTARYRGGAAAGGSGREERVGVERLVSAYSGTSPLPRLAASLLDGARLAGRAARRSDWLIVLTDPPLLPLWVQAAAERHGCRWFEWTMDLYPEVLAAGGVLGPGHPLYRWLDRRSAALRPAGRLCLGPAQQAFIERRRGDRGRPTALWPAGDLPQEAPGTPAAVAWPPTVIAAGNHGAMHPPGALPALVAAAAGSPLRFKLALHGARVAELRRQLAGHPAVSWHSRLEDGELASAAAHFVGLRREASHLSVPSRAVTALGWGRPVIFAGAPESDVWQWLSGSGAAAGWLLPERSDGRYDRDALLRVVRAVADAAQREACAEAAVRVAAELAAQRAATLQTLGRWLTAPPPRLWDVP